MQPTPFDVAAAVSRLTDPTHRPTDQDEERIRQQTRWRHDETRKLRDAENASPFTGVTRQTLQQLKTHPPAPVEWTIERLAAQGSITFALGTFKSGKSSLVVNLLKSLADGDPFLCTYRVRKIEGAIGYFDFEMGLTETYDRLKRVGCYNDSKIFVYDMVAEGFNLSDDRDYGWLKEEIIETGMEVIVIDALRHLAKKRDGNSDSEIQEIFDRLERLRKDCPTLADIFIPTHTAKGDARPGDDITALGSAAWDGGAQYRWGSYRTKAPDGWKFWFCLLPSRRTDSEAAVPREIRMDDNGVLSLGHTGTAAAAAAKSRRDDERKAAIRKFVEANQPTSKNKICREVGGTKSTVLDQIGSMHNEELFIDDTGSVWTYDHYMLHLPKS